MNQPRYPVQGDWMENLWRLRLRLIPRGSRRELVWRFTKAPGRHLTFFRRRLFPKKTGLPLVSAPGFGRWPQEGVPGLISVVLPVYNQADLIGQCLQTLLAQSYGTFEVLLVNDGSTDNLASALEPFAGNSRLRLLEQPHQGLAQALNNGFSLARGEFLTWTSADNFHEPEYLKRLAECLQSRPEAAMVYADFLIVDGLGQPIRDPLVLPQYRRPPDSSHIRLPLDTGGLAERIDNTIGPCFLYRAFAAGFVGEYEESLRGVEDWEYWVRMADSFSIVHLGSREPLYHYRYHSNSLTAQLSYEEMSLRREQLRALTLERKSTPNSTVPKRLRAFPYTPRPRPLKILLQVDQFLVGGLENAVINQGLGLSSLGHEISILILGRAGAAAERAKELGFQVLAFSEKGREQDYRNVLCSRGFDLINAHYSTYGASLASELGIAFVQTLQNAYVWLNEIQRSKFLEADPYTTAYVAVSDFVAQYSEKALGLNVEKMVIIENQILPDRQYSCPNREELRHRLGLSVDDFVFLHPAAVYYPKAQRALVRAFARMHRNFPKARLVLLGEILDSSYFEQVVEDIGRLRLEDAVQYHPFTEPTPFFKMADAVALPSLWEGWSLALAEGLYHGLRAVATDVGGAGDLIRRLGGELVAPPFDRITDLRERHLSVGPEGDEAFVERLSIALGRVCEGVPVAGKALETFRSRVGQQEAVKEVERLFQWLAQGGHPCVARAFLKGDQYPERPFTIGEIP